MAGLGEPLRVGLTVSEVRHEHGAEEEHLSRQECPHTQRGGLPLLGHFLEMLGQGTPGREGERPREPWISL